MRSAYAPNGVNTTLISIYYNDAGYFNTWTVNGVPYEDINGGPIKKVEKLIYPPVAKNIKEAFLKYPKFATISALYDRLSSNVSSLIANMKHLTFLAPTETGFNNFRSWLSARGTDFDTFFSNSSSVDQFFLLHCIRPVIFTSVITSEASELSVEGSRVWFNSTKHVFNNNAVANITSPDIVVDV